MTGRLSWICGLAGIMLLALAATIIGLGSPAERAVASSSSRVTMAAHVGVASCAGSTCHGRNEPDGKVVRQDELMRWQEPSSQTGAHSRAFAVLSDPRGQVIAARLGLGSASTAPMCLGCHSDPAAGGKGPRFLVTDGVGCEGCHGAATNWISSHYAVGASHAANVANGLYPLERPRARAEKCLDCHFGSDRGGQFVTHRIMAAGHPRISFELDLFTSLQAHHDEDADYVQRKGATDNVQVWAVGQAAAVSRALSLHGNAKLATEGVFPEFYFFDCHSCHRRILDDVNARPTAVANPGRPIPAGMPPFNDENMIMLSAAARVGAPALAARFDADSKAFHAALASDRGSAIKAGAKLRSSAEALADALGNRRFGRGESFAMIDAIAAPALTARFTDYEGSVQAVMAADTLLNALVRNGYVAEAQAKAIRGDIDRAYKAVHDPNDYRPADFRAALAKATGAIKALR